MHRWNALSPVEQANPQRYANLVGTTEGVVRAICAFLNPGAKTKDEVTSLMMGESLELDQFKQDIKGNTSNGTISFLNTWTEKHQARKPLSL